MNIEKIKNYFNTAVPALSFTLAGECVVSVDVATINNAKRLASSFQEFVHPDVLRFLDLVAVNEEDDIDAAYRAIMRSSGYKRFVFYLTVYCGRLDLMLEMHAVAYLPKIGIPLDSVVSTEYYPYMEDALNKHNPYAILFDSDIKQLLHFCETMQNTYLRVNLIQDYKDVSAVNILGYLDCDVVPS